MLQREGALFSRRKVCLGYLCGFELHVQGYPQDPAVHLQDCVHFWGLRTMHVQGWRYR